MIVHPVCLPYILSLQIKENNNDKMFDIIEDKVLDSLLALLTAIAFFCFKFSSSHFFKKIGE
jgi:hypothetical protein